MLTSGLPFGEVLYIWLTQVNKGEIKLFIKSMNQLNSGWCHTVIKFHLHYSTVTLLNNSVELSSNLDKPVP